MTSAETDLSVKETTSTQSESSTRLYFEAAEQFATSFGRAAVSPLTGAAEMLTGSTSDNTLTNQASPTENQTTAQSLGTAAGTAFDFVLGALVLRRMLPGMSAFTRSTALNSGLGFLQSTQDGSFSSHIGGAVAGFGTGIAMGGVEAAWRSNGLASRLASSTISSIAGGVANVELSSKLQTGQFASMPQIGEAALTWGGVALALGGLGEGGSAVFKSMVKPATYLKMPVHTAPDQSLASNAMRLATDKVSAAEKAPLKKLSPVIEQIVPAAPPETVVDRIRRIAQHQSWYSRVQKADTHLKCVLYTNDLSEALTRDGIENIQVATTDGSVNHMPMHVFILAKTETGGIVHVDPTISQFVPNYPDIFIGTRPQLLDIARTSHGDIKVWQKITENRTNWNRIWAEQPLLYPKRFVEPTEAQSDSFTAKWGSAGVDMYRDHLTSVFEQAKKDPDWRQHLVREFPPAMVQRVDAAMAEWSAQQAADNPAATAEGAANRRSGREVLHVAA